MASLTNEFAVLAKKTRSAGGKDIGGSGGGAEDGAKTIDGATLHVNASEERMLDGGAAILKKAVSLFGINDITGKENHAGGLHVAEQVAEARGERSAVEADDQQLADLLFAGASFARDYFHRFLLDLAL
jgi:hypothetical protein